MGNKKVVFLKVFLFIAFIGILGLLCYLNTVKHYREEVAALSIETIDLSTISDGTYVGDCDVNYIYAKVEVTVKSGKITDIKLVEHKNDRGKPAESILEAIVKTQNIKVDTVSGATNSSKVIMKAIERALTSESK